MKYSINTKLTAMFAVGVFAAFMLQLWSFLAMRSIERNFVEFDTMYRRVELSQHLNYHSHKLLRLSSEYVLTRDQKKRDLFDQVLKETAITLRSIEALPPYAPWDAVSSRVKGEVRELSEITIEIVYSDSVIHNDALAEIMKKGSVLTDDITALIEKFHEDVLAELTVMRKQSDKEIRWIKLVVYAFFGIGAIVTVFLYSAMRTRVTIPIDELYRGAKRLARGDYIHGIRVETGDELEHLAAAMNKMAVTLKEREEKLFTLLKMVDNVNKELMAANRHKSDFLSHVSHELKTPLTHVLGFSDLLSMEMEKTMTPAAKSHLASINKGGKDLLALIESLLEVAKSGDGMAPELKDVSPAGLVHEVMEELMPKAKAKNHKVELDIASGIMPCKLDVLMFKQIVTNLFDNAVKFTPEGGLIKVHLSEHSDSKYNRRLKFSVQDNGIGISDELKPVLFSPFMIGESGLVREYGGIGMGLTLTKRFVEYHNGTISVTSEQGKGATFTVDMSV